MSSSKSFILLFLCALLVTFGHQQTPAQEKPNQAQRLLSRAVQLHQAGDLEGAIREYKNFLIIYPNIIEVRSNLGAAYARLGRYEEAVEQYQQAVKLDKSNNPAIRFNLALGYYKMGKLNEAAQEFARLVASDATNTNATLLLADCYLRSGEVQKVIHLLSPLQAKLGEDKTFAYLLGSALIHAHQTAQGQLLIDRILRDGDSAEARLMMGVAQLLAHDYTGAVNAIKRAIDLNDKLPVAHSFYGQALLGAGDREGALQAFQQELLNNANDFEANLYIGILLKEEQKFDQALPFFQQAQRVRPQELNVNYFIASVQMALGKMDEAQKLLEAVVKEAPDFVEAHVLLATAYYRLKRKDAGDRERRIIQKLNAERQANAPGAKANLGPAYRGESVPPPPTKKPEEQHP
ncbi:MAG: tetratricopeptide repeat protein [Acidobacteria bacterium]|nr:tetratricopeptide repeat protein [Acidobacteriota bacterium]